jgi:hypothetical protein
METKFHYGAMVRLTAAQARATGRSVTVAESETTGVNHARRMMVCFGKRLLKLLFGNVLAGDKSLRSKQTTVAQARCTIFRQMVVAVAGWISIPPPTTTDRPIIIGPPE